MGSKRPVESSSKSASSPSGNKDGKLKGLVGASKLSDRGVIKVNNERSEVSEFQAIGVDPHRIEAMTVQQLRAALRSVGIPSRGLKSDLVSALRSFLDQEAGGQSCSQEASVELNGENVADEADQENGDAGQEVSRNQGRKKRAKKALVLDETIMTKTAISKQKISNKSDGVSEMKSSRTKSKVHTEMETVNANASVGVDVSVNQPEPWTIFAHKKPQKGWVVYNPRTMRPPPLSRDINFVKLMSWNVNGLRALLKMEGFSALQLAQREDFDVLCLQETKLQEKDVEAIRDTLINGYDHSFWTCSVSKLGYSGTAIISRIKPLSVTYGLGNSDHDSEGRLVTAEFSSFYLLSAYVPNSGDGLRRLSYRVTEWDQALSNYMKELEKSKPVILTGDLNCAHEEIDIYNPAGNKRSAGFTDEERQSFEKCYLSQGFVDTFRKQHPGVVGYSYWGYRHGGRKNNRGWRLDYFLVSELIADNVYDSYILPDVTGSDHSPIGLVLKL